MTKEEKTAGSLPLKCCSAVFTFIIIRIPKEIIKIAVRNLQYFLPDDIVL